MAIFLVDPATVVVGSWKSNKWYKCPNCHFDGLDISFNHCPGCGEGLDWSDVEVRNDELETN